MEIIINNNKNTQFFSYNKYKDPITFKNKKKKNQIIVIEI